MVVCYWLGESPHGRFLFLTNREAQALWHPSGNRGFFGTHEDQLRPDEESIRKLEVVGKPS